MGKPTSWRFFFSDKPGYLRATEHDAIMKRVDEQGNIPGFSIMQVGRLTSSKPLMAELVSEVAA